MSKSSTSFPNYYTLHYNIIIAYKLIINITSTTLNNTQYWYYFFQVFSILKFHTKNYPQRSKIIHEREVSRDWRNSVQTSGDPESNTNFSNCPFEKLMSFLFEHYSIFKKNNCVVQSWRFTIYVTKLHPEGSNLLTREFRWRFKRCVLINISIAALIDEIL